MVEVIRKYWNQIQDIIVDWYQVLEPHVQGTGKDSGGKRIEDNEVHMMLLEYLQSSVHTCEFSPRLICLERIAGSCEFSS